MNRLVFFFAICANACHVGRTEIIPENGGTNVAGGLMECYNITDLYERDFRLPATVNMVIDLIRQVEEAAPSLDARNLAIQLLHRFRQDGIEKVVNHSPYILPYSPRGKQKLKNLILLRDLIPGDASRFPNSSLTAPERCGLHFMLSNSFDRAERGDETAVCKRLGQYVQRPRNVRKRDAEDLDVSLNQPRPFGDFVGTRSACPVENGAVYTRWGAIQAGAVIGAVAAGLEPQRIQKGAMVDSRFAVTLAGDLAEVGLHEGIRHATFTIGGKGGWNSTLSPHWYFIDAVNKKDAYLTDPELRGNIDGLILSMNIKDWANTYRTLKLSQLLDMYYSNRGVFSSEIKACNRNKFVTQYAPAAELTAQTIAFANLYNNEAELFGSPTPENIEEIAETAVNSFYRSITTIADVKCDPEDLNRIATNLIIVVDTTWKYESIHPSLSYLLNNIDVSKFDSSFMVINANDGSVLVNESISIAKFEQGFNRTLWDSISSTSDKGFDAYRFMDKVEETLRNRIENAKAGAKLDGKSSTILLVPRTADDSQTNYLQTRYSSVLDQYYPDTHVIVLAGGSKESYNNYVRNSAQDIFTIPESASSQEDQTMRTMNLLLKRFRDGADSNYNTMELYIEPSTTNYYKIAPTYLSGTETKSLKVRGQNGGKVKICTSRTDPKIQEAQGCETLDSGEKNFDFTCSGTCDPFYFSIYGEVTTNNRVVCSAPGCRFPDNIKLSIQVDGFSCEAYPGGATQMTISLYALFGTICLYLLKM